MQFIIRLWLILDAQEMFKCRINSSLIIWSFAYLCYWEMRRSTKENLLGSPRGRFGSREVAGKPERWIWSPAQERTIDFSGGGAQLPVNIRPPESNIWSVTSCDSQLVATVSHLSKKAATWGTWTVSHLEQKSAIWAKRCWHQRAA